jgi:hypothetical protein
MKTLIKNSVNRFGLTFLVLLTTLILGTGCAAPKPTPDPLVGWNILFSRDYEKLDKSITDDYQAYIQKLAADERNSHSPVSFFVWSAKFMGRFIGFRKAT